jgi:hypothetical protein
MTRFIWLAAPAAMTVAAFAPAAHGIVNWSNPTGSNSLFSWAGGYEDNGFYGDPTVTTNGFAFTTPNFFAVNPGNPSITDTLHVNVTVQPGQTITDVAIYEIGTRSSTNRTTIQGTLHLADLTNGGPDQVYSLTYTNDSGSPITWNGSAFATSLPFGAGITFHLDLTNNLSALLAGQNIHKSGVEIVFTPAPGALAMAGIAALTLGGRRRVR